MRNGPSVKCGGVALDVAAPPPVGAWWLYTMSEPVPEGARDTAERVDVVNQSAVLILRSMLGRAGFGFIMGRLVDPDDVFDNQAWGNLITDCLEATSGRPYWVDVALARACVTGWNTVSARLAVSGVVNPMRDMASVHKLLDVTEGLILEGKTDDKERARYWSQMYTPPSGITRAPRGWSVAAEQSKVAAVFGAPPNDLAARRRRMTTATSGE